MVRRKDGLRPARGGLRLERGRLAPLAGAEAACVRDQDAGSRRAASETSAGPHSLAPTGGLRSEVEADAALRRGNVGGAGQVRQGAERQRRLEEREAREDEERVQHERDVSHDARHLVIDGHEEDDEQQADELQADDEHEAQRGDLALVTDAAAARPAAVALSAAACAVVNATT